MAYRLICYAEVPSIKKPVLAGSVKRSMIERSSFHTACSTGLLVSGACYIFGLQAFLALNHRKLDLLAFDQ